MSTWQDLKNNPCLKNIYNQRLEIIKATREFFWSFDFKETDTPIAVRYPGQEPYLNVVPIKIHPPASLREALRAGDTHNTIHEMYLRTSPEFALKKLLASGYSKIFEIGGCFRNGESFGGLHNPEFTMLEWYRAPGALTEIMDDTENLFKFIGNKLAVETQNFASQNTKWDRLSMKEVWQKYAGINLDNNLTIQQLSITAKELGNQITVEDAYEDIFFKIFLNKIESNLGKDRPIFIYDYPAQMCSLSKLSKIDPCYAERAELYINGIEIANGFGELTDAKEQKANLEKDKQFRAKLGKPTWPVDPDFIAALAGLPAGALAQAGIALGMDRMVLLFTGAHDINEVIFQSVSDQLQ